MSTHRKGGAASLSASTSARENGTTGYPLHLSQPSSHPPSHHRTQSRSASSKWWTRQTMTAKRKRSAILAVLCTGFLLALLVQSLTGFKGTASFEPLFSSGATASSLSETLHLNDLPNILSITKTLGRKKRECIFTLSKDPLPVHHDPKQLIYHNLPNSKHRSRNQFSECETSFDRVKDPILTLITVTHNPGPRFEETVLNIQEQSLKNWGWIIVDDHSDDPESLARLSKAAENDKRLEIVKNGGSAGVVTARTLGLETMLSGTPYHSPYWVMVDDDDLFEFTAFEKAVWMLESNPQWSIASHFWTRFGFKNFTETRGLHLGLANYYADNYVANTAVIRREAVGDCRYDQQFQHGGEDWDVWLCMAEHGHWGGVLPEVNYWYRWNDPAFRKARWGESFDTGLQDMKAAIHKKHAKLIDNFPSIPAPSSKTFEKVQWHPAFHNVIPNTAAEKSVMVILPSLTADDLGVEHLLQVQALAEAGYRVTVVCTQNNGPASVKARPWMMQWTHDIHILPTFLRPVDFPRYIKYLASTRDISMLYLSHNVLGYELLPALKEHLPSVAIVDFVYHMDPATSGLSSPSENDEGEEAQPTQKSITAIPNKFPRYSVIHQRYIDRTIVSSESLRQSMIEEGYDSRRIGLVESDNDGFDNVNVTSTQTTKESTQKDEYSTSLIEEVQIAFHAHSKPRTSRELTTLPHPAGELAIQSLLFNHPDDSDLTDAQERLVPYKPRTGFGGELQVRCGETEDNGYWLDGVVDVKTCPGTPPIDVKALQTSALHQCSFWCVWDLHTRKKKGWQFKWADCWPITLLIVIAGCSLLARFAGKK